MNTSKKKGAEVVEDKDVGLPFPPKWVAQGDEPDAPWFKIDVFGNVLDKIYPQEKSK